MKINLNPLKLKKMNDFDFIKWILNNCVYRGLNCLQYNGIIYDLDKEKEQKNLFSEYLKNV